MSPSVLLRGGVIFLGAFLLHVLVWRLLKPKAQIAWLFVVFILLPLVAFGGLLIASSDRLNWCFSFVLYFSLAGVYIQTYPAIQANCPSLFIVNIIGRSQGGLDLQDVQERIEKVGLTKLDDRMNDLVNDNFISVSTGDLISLTGKGRALIQMMILLRQKLLGLKEGEG